MNMLFVRTLCYALLMHESLYLCRDGTDYLTRAFLPTLGLRLAPRMYMMLHLAFMGICSWLMFHPQAWALYPVLFVTLSLIIASYSLRVSNHLILAWFMVALLCASTFLQHPHERGLELSRFLLRGVEDLIILTYALSFLHKLNTDFLSPQHSCASQLSDFLCWDRRIERASTVKIARLLAIHGTLLAEGLIPICLLFPRLLPLGLLLGFAFHFALGVLGIINFSTVMYAGLLTFVAPSFLPQVMAGITALGWPTIAACAITCLLTLCLLMPRNANRHCPYVARRPAWVLQLCFGCVSALLFLGTFVLFRAGPIERVAWASLSDTEQVSLAIFLAIFGLNGLSPYLGLKTEFSFAMFSNLRHEPWRHLLLPASWKPFDLCSYVKIERLEGLPELDPTKESSASKMALFLLGQAHAYRFSSYFFRESIRLVREAAQTPTKIRVVFIERGRRFEIEDFDGRTESDWLSRLRVNLFPFMMPVDPNLPHTEQGTVRRQGERQLF